MINVTKSYLGNKNKFKAYVDRIYNTGWLTNHGPLVTALEQRLKDYLGVRNIILTNNGTIALQIAYRALGITGSAITTPFSFVATTSSLQWEGIRPIFADIDPATWNLDPNQIMRHIEPDTTAIVATHVFGNPCDVERIGQIARQHNLKVIYDGAHAFGSLYKGRSVYSWGDISTLSFHATKLFHTIEGGAIVTDDDDLAERVRLLCNFGIVDTDQIEGIGINAKLNEFSAAMGMCVLDDIELIDTPAGSATISTCRSRNRNHRATTATSPLRWPMKTSCCAAEHSSMKAASIRVAISILRWTPSNTSSRRCHNLARGR